MSEMEHRVRDALKKALSAQGFTVADGVDSAVIQRTEGPVMVYVPALVRVAIKAMREPTQSMLDAVCSDEPYAMIKAKDGPVTETWREMIDAALNSPPASAEPPAG